MLVTSVGVGVGVGLGFVQRQVPVLRPISPESRDRCFDPSLPKTLPRIPQAFFLPCGNLFLLRILSSIMPTTS